MAKKKKQTYNKDALLSAIIALILGLGGGYTIAQLTDDKYISSNESISTDEVKHMHSDLYNVEAENAPTVSFVVEEDAKSGWNVNVMTANFKFAPEKINRANVVGEGHAHLYVDGVKISRLYGNYFHYDEKFDGTKTFKVTLNANDHSQYVVNGVPIYAEIEVSHDHNSMPHAGHLDDDHQH